ncbi:MAG: flagellar FliJ protein [Oceanicoccus sp.]|jgi:flagellar FliJ protein
MAKKSSERLQTVLKLAQLKQQQAAEKLAENIRNTQAQAQQQASLEEYKLEYNDQFSQLTRQGRHASQLANYQRFYGNLQQAGEAQIERNKLAQSLLEQARGQWQQLYFRRKKLEGLVQQKQYSEQREEGRKEQRELDDRSVPSIVDSSV